MFIILKVILCNFYSFVVGFFPHLVRKNLDAEISFQNIKFEKRLKMNKKEKKGEKGNRHCQDSIITEKENFAKYYGTNSDLLVWLRNFSHQEQEKILVIHWGQLSVLKMQRWEYFTAGSMLKAIFTRKSREV